MRALGLAALLAALACAAAHGSAAQFKSLPHFNYELHEFFVGTDRSWANATEVSPGPAGNRPSWAYNRKLPMAMVWLDECDRPPQKARFRKKILLPGALSSGKAFIQLASETARARPRHVTLLVNDKVVMKWRRGMSSYGEPLGTDALKAFHYGPNTIELRAKRRRIPKGSPRCNHPNGDRVGVVAGLSGQATTDIRIPTRQQTAYRRAALGKPHLTQLHVNVFNDGPATSVEGTFAFTVSSGPYRDFFFVTAKAPAPFGECEYARSDKKLVAIRCPWTDFPPGGHVVVDIDIGGIMYPEWDVPADVSTTTWKVDGFAAPGVHTWQTSAFIGDGTRSDLDEDHFFTYTEVVCFREPASDPGCANAGSR